MGVQQFTQPDYSTQSGTVYPTGIDKAIAVHHRLAGPFAPHQQDVGSPAPDLSIRLDAGAIFYNGTLTEIAAQTVTGFTVPSSGQHRIDRVALNPSTGAATRIAGTAVTGSPSATPPAITAGLVPLCSVLITSSDTAILNSMITDERSFQPQSASDTLQGAIEVAVQSEMEAGSDTTRAVTPGRQHYHPSAAKVWTRFNGTGTPAISSGYNAASITDNGTGNYGVNTTVAFSDTANMCGVMSYAQNDGTVFVDITDANTFDVRTRTAAGGFVDIATIFFVGFGDQ